MQQGIHASNTIKRRLGGKEAKAFRYRDLGSMATISRFRAVVSFKGIRLSGFVGWLVWLFVHLTFLTGFKNRLSTIPRWAFTFIGNSRPERTITMQQIVARVAIEEAGGRPFLLSLTSDDERAQDPGGQGAQVIGSRRVDGFEALTLSAGDGEMESSRLRPRGGDGGLLVAASRGGVAGPARRLARYVAERSTMGIPLLHPWANRVARRDFAVAGREVDLWAHPRARTPWAPRGYRSTASSRPLRGGVSIGTRTLRRVRNSWPASTSPPMRT